MDDEKLRSSIDALPYPKVSQSDIDKKIVSVSYFILPESTITICNIKLANGFSVLGESACVDPRNFDKEIGQTLAYKNAFDKLWPLFGFLLAEKIHGAV